MGVKYKGSCSKCHKYGEINKPRGKCLRCEPTINKRYSRTEQEGGRTISLRNKEDWKWSLHLFGGYVLLIILVFAITWLIT